MRHVLLGVVNLEHEAGVIVEMSTKGEGKGDCDDIDATLHSESVRKMLELGDAAWKKLVPENARRLIEERQLFRYRP